MKSRKIALIAPAVLALAGTTAVVSCSVTDETKIVKDFKETNKVFLAKDKLEVADFKTANTLNTELSRYSKSVKSKLATEVTKIEHIIAVETEYNTYNKAHDKVANAPTIDVLDYTKVNSAIDAYNALKTDTKTLLKESNTKLKAKLASIIELQKVAYLFKTPTTETKAKIEEVLTYKATLSNKTRSEMIALLSEKFLNTPYVANKMVGAADQNEALVVDVNELDCFTYLDYLVAFTMSTTYDEFVNNVAKVRYVDGRVSYQTRKHFYSDWAVRNTKLAQNVVTEELVGKDNIIKYTKDINYVLDKNKEPSSILKTVPTDMGRKLVSIKWDKVTDELMTKFKSGDMIMLQAPDSLKWLDVTHVGILIIKEEGGKKVAYYRNASSQSTNMKVVDTPLVDYLKYRNTDSAGNLKAKPSVPGILVYRILETIA